jgi:hypothetical protein
VKHVHAKDHLFQRAGRHGADDDGIIAGQAIGRRGQGGMNAAKVNKVGNVPLSTGGTLQVADVPALAQG